MHLAPSNGGSRANRAVHRYRVGNGLMLGSCAQWQAEQELRQSQQAQAQAQAAATAANDDAQCQSYGAAPGHSLTSNVG